MHWFLMSLAAIGLSGSVVWADDGWWQWRGPQRNNISPDKNLLENWTSAPQFLWKVENLGLGYSSPVVRNDVVCVTADRGPRCFVIAIDVKTGKEIWAADVDDAKEVRRNCTAHPGPYSTPAIDGERIYALSNGGRFVCLEAATGKLIWSKDYEHDYHGRTARSKHGFSDSPLIDGDKVICTPGGLHAAIIALDKKTGKEIWRCAASFPNFKKPTDGIHNEGWEGASYASMIVSYAAGVKQYVQLMGKGLVGVNAETGAQLWSYSEFRGGRESVPTPAARGDYVLCCHEGGGALLKLHKRKDEFTVEKIRDGRGIFMGDYALIGDHLYMVETGSMLCAEFLTGKVVWRKNFHNVDMEGGMAFADGNLYFQTGGRNGTVFMVAATPQGYQLKGSFDIPRDKRLRGARCVFSQPAISNGRLFLREVNRLYCYDLMRK